ncbi:unnamed protein product [Diamesa serratosioi]
MLINEIDDKSHITCLVIKELRQIGIKYQSEKQKRTTPKRGKMRIFKVPLHMLPLEDFVLANGSVVQIPQFLIQMSNRILEESSTEGIFRKSGNNKRQLDIKAHLEKGKVINENHHVIDVANLLKLFLRELPHPLIPFNVQEVLIRCLMCSSYEQKVEALLIGCLLLPPLSINTLAFFLQFLKHISTNSELNKMTITNLSIILTPNIMPLPEKNTATQRLNSHCKVIEILIENSNSIGIVPERMLNQHDITPAPVSEIVPITEEKVKKKRRSGSLNRMFIGFRKIVGNAIGSSSESLDKSRENSSEDFLATTPCVTKSSKKRKLDKMDNISAFSSRKKKDVLSTLREDDDDLLQCSPINNDLKKSRLSLNCRRLGASRQTLDKAPPMERRWSIVSGSAWNRKKTNTEQKSSQVEPVQVTSTVIQHNEPDEEYVKISKSEYLAIEGRICTIETKLSQEINSAKVNALKIEMNSLKNGPENVQNKFYQMQEKESNNAEFQMNTDNLAKRLSRDLKIRRSVENQIIRSPSLRKIGSMKKRLRENSSKRLSRNQSWHLGNQSSHSLGKTEEFVSTAIFYPKSNLKRGRPNTVQTGLCSQQQQQQSMSTELRANRRSSMSDKTPPEKRLLPPNETWTPATDFFDNPSNDRHDLSMQEEQKLQKIIDDSIFKTPIKPIRMSTMRSTVKRECNKTPMLPPTLPPRTPMSAHKRSPMNFNKTPQSLVNKNLTPLQDSSQPRASIARIRSQNAGMVLKKAELFGGAMKPKPSDSSALIVNKKLENIKNMLKEESPQPFKNSKSAINSPRRSPRTPGVKKQIVHSKNQSPNGFKPSLIRERVGFENNDNYIRRNLLNREICSPRNPNSVNNSPRKTPIRDRRPPQSPRSSNRMRVNLQ